jgi:predicted nucleotidyltransferase
MKPTEIVDPIAVLQGRVNQKWAAIGDSAVATMKITKEIDKLLAGFSTTDTSIVVFGSLARKEWTSKSDIDWTLLVDGQADPQHLEIAQKIGSQLTKGKFQEPGASGIFGNMTFSHDLVQKIGGREDTNENTTRRVLLLQESTTIGKPDARERVLRLLISRYLKDDRGLRFGTVPYKVPRFLLNDIVRYWRTITVDFVDKQRGQAGHGWGLRNAKLRMSRKLIFATGMLSCFSCELLCSQEARTELLKHNSTVAMEEHLRAFIKLTPLEILATVLLELRIRKRTADRLFSSYNAFLAMLDVPKKRKHLKALHPDDVPGSAVFNEVRKFSRDFQAGLTDLFFNDHEKLRELTIFYGVF